MSRRVCITGLGPVAATGFGVEPFWNSLLKGESKLSRIDLFEPDGFLCHVGGQVPEYKIRDYVPKSYRKATKVMARDIEIAVIAADLAARDAGLSTPGTAPDAEPTYTGDRSGCNIGAGLIAAELNELTAALATSAQEDGSFDIHDWGREGIKKLTPLWLLKYLPNMLACHVTIVHDLRGPSNTITCGEPSGSLSVCESVRAIQRGAADCCFAGGAESKMNPMAYLRQQFSGVHTGSSNDEPAQAVKPMDAQGDGTATGEGGAILILEALETAQARGASDQIYAEVSGFAATQSINRQAINRAPHPEGHAIKNAIGQALNRAKLTPNDVDFIVPSANGVAAFDQAEAQALQTVFGDRSAEIPLVTPKPLIGSCCAGVSGPDLVAACLCLKHQKLPKTINRDQPLPGTHPGFNTPQDAELKHGLVLTAGFSGQTTAIVLSRSA